MENRSFNLNSDKGFIAAIAIALVIVASIVAGYYALNRPAPSGYSTLYLLDAQNQAVNYPDVLVANRNSTFNMQVVVENHMAKPQDYQLQVKIIQNVVSFPVNAPANSTYERSLADTESWENQVPITINQPGSYAVVFELWSKNEGESAYSFTDNFCVLNLQVVSS
jgi:uncharacterized membrane protein